MTPFLITRGDLSVRRMLGTPSAVTRPARTAQAIAPFSGATKALALETMHSHRTDRDMRGYLAARRNESEQFFDRVLDFPPTPFNPCAPVALSAVGTFAVVAPADPGLPALNSPFFDQTTTGGDADLDGGIGTNLP